jgi:hypothetical protein
MQYEVKLIRNGSQFYDYVHANGQNEARDIAIHRNPGSTFLGANAVSDGYDNHDNYHTTSSGTYDGSSNYDDPRYDGESIGCFGFVFGLFRVVLIIVLGIAALTLFSPSENNKENNQSIQKTQVRENSFARSFTNSLDEYDATNRR